MITNELAANNKDKKADKDKKEQAINDRISNYTSKLKNQGWPIDQIKIDFEKSWQNIEITKKLGITFDRNWLIFLMFLDGETRTEIEYFLKNMFAFTDFGSNLSKSLYPCLSKIICEYETNTGETILPNRKQDKRSQPENTNDEYRESDNKINDWAVIKSTFAEIYKPNPNHYIIERLSSVIKKHENNETFLNYQKMKDIIKELQSIIYDLENNQ